MSDDVLERRAKVDKVLIQGAKMVVGEFKYKRNRTGGSGTQGDSYYGGKPIVVVDKK